MRDTGKETVAEHYGKLLGIEPPWEVRTAQLDLLRGQVEIEVAWNESALVVCPECGEPCARHDHAPAREWRHLNVMQFLTIIRARVPRCACSEHGVKTVRTPWAEPGSHFTLHFELFAVQVIAACRSLTQAADLLELGWDGVQRIVDRAVARGLARRSTDGVLYVGLDEKSFGRGQRYVSIATDIKGARVLEVVPGNDQAAGESLWQALPAEQRSRVAAAAMDMSAGFAAATRTQAPQAAIVHDKFHVAKLLNDAVDQTRRAEHQQLQAAGDDTLKHTRYLWLHGQVPEAKRAGFAELLEINLKTARAWAYKEQFVEFWAQPSVAHGADFFAQWRRSVMRSRLSKVKAVAKTLHRHLTNLLTYFLHPITNAVSEGFNSRIQAIKADARGFRRFANYRTRILFHCGKLNLLPVLPSSPTH
ncbi:MAG: ISL3 family transposase [Reyranella sp.]|nr:ISL3 family transposase [Candidatus Didemnitutus sp.]MDP1963356.1 ISL3 family transposase [Reyranella sp.]